MSKANQQQQAVRDLCARVMNLCDAVTDANKLTYLNGLKKIAASVKTEALGVSKLVWR